MPLRAFTCQECGTEFRTKALAPVHCGDVACTPLLIAPKAKFMEKVDQDHGKSRMIGQEKILRERSRAHSRTVEISDLVCTNSLDTAQKNGWIKENGKIRKKIDDL